ncbi:MAG: hypothetical protein JO058_03450 [Alphaproteobacteria bacterium]|nr:hypothetical protein [Alphaproteobacteria bacterium]MBV9154441.1 hypothetical protein [Alphaproteobacteria bacterium]
MFSEEQTAFLSGKSGLKDLSSLIYCVRACGFDEGAYLAAHPDLQAAGFDPTSALFHFLAHGIEEHRTVPGGRLPDGLAALVALEIPDPAYASRLFRNLFFGQLADPETAAWLWYGVDGALLECIRAARGVPYFIIGDSHANHYRRNAARDIEWLAPLPLLCHGASAIRLADEAARSPHGANILRWARTTVRQRPKLDAPIFLKFGGIDAQFLWVRRRIRNRVYQFSTDDFDALADESVKQYARFLDALADIVDPKLLRVCSVFPPAITDADWEGHFLEAHRDTPEHDRYLAAELRKMELPDLGAWTELRARYNRKLRGICDKAGLVFVDVLSPFLDSKGVVDKRYLGAAGDFHINYDATEEPLVELIWRHVSSDSSRDALRGHPAAE